MGPNNDRFAKPLNVETGGSLGEVTAHSRALLTTALRAEKLLFRLELF